jgi:hypothetical protein
MLLCNKNRYNAMKLNEHAIEICTLQHVISLNAAWFAAKRTFDLDLLRSREIRLWQGVKRPERAHRSRVHVSYGTERTITTCMIVDPS